MTVPGYICYSPAQGARMDGSGVLEIIPKYLEAIDDQIATRTNKNYRLELEWFSRWLGGRELSVEVLRELKAELMGRMEVTSVRTKLTVVKCFVRWMFNEDIVSVDYGAKITKPRVKRYGPPPNVEDRLISMEMLEKVIEAILPGKFHNSRHRESMEEAKLALRFLLRYPLRINELLGLTHERLNLDASVPEFLALRKNGRWEWLGLPLDMVEELRGKKGLLFKTSGDMIRHHLREGCKKVGVKKITPHKFRHIVGTRMIEDGASVEKVAEMLGHTPKTMWGIYKQYSSKSTSDTVNLWNPAVDKSVVPVEFSIRALKEQLKPLMIDERFDVDVSKKSIVIRW